MNENNDILCGMSIDRFGQLVEEVSAKRYLTIPTAVGFCVYIKRECINAVGLWDESFGMGYGEENDFAMRARTKGYVCKVADDTFVFHSGSTSFKTASGDLDERKISNEKLLKQRWPEYHKEIFAFCIINPLREIQQRIHDGISRWIAGDKPHIMQVLHSYEADAGTELHTKHLVTELKEFFRYTLFFPENKISDSEAKSYVSKDSIMELHYASRNLASDIYFTNIPSSLRSGVIETNFERILRSSDIKIVHFQHMLNYGTFKLPFIAKSLGLKVAITLHDYFYICPVFNLLKVDHTMCHKINPDGKDEDCMNCFSRNLQLENQDTNTHNIKVYMAQRHEAVMDALKAADIIISPSTYVKNKISLSFGKSIGDKVRVIPHGVEIPANLSVPVDNKKLAVNFLGNATVIKGFDVFGQAAIRLKKKVLFTQNGSGQRELLDKYRRYVRLKGPYKHKDLAEIFKRTDLVVIPSIWEESFCYTLSEAMAHGVPVIASDAGALSERVVQGRNGYLFTVGDVDALVEIIEKLQRDPQHLREMKEYCRNNTPASRADMWEIYRTLYDDLLNERNTEKDVSSEDAGEHTGKEVKV
jgi:glycosyltransferase involved in cell wall biosynthesis